MRFHDKMLQELQNHGLWEDEAKAVLDAVKFAPTSEPFVGRWRDEVEDYPPVVWNLLWIGAKKEAARWLAENKPEHWARPMFDDKLLKEPNETKEK